MKRGDSLVAETPVDLEDPLEPTDHEPFKVELRSDPEKELHVEGVVMRPERFGCCSSGDGMEHGGFDLTETLAVKEFTDSLNDKGAREEDLFDLRVGNQIEIAPAIPNLNVGKAMPLLRKGTKRFSEETELLNLKGKLSCLRPENFPFQSDEISDIESFKELEGFFTDDLFLKVNLYLSIPVLDLNKTGLAEIPDGHDPSCKAEGLRD